MFKTRSETTTKITEAILKFQAAIRDTPIIEDAKGNRSSYSTFENTAYVITPLLIKCELSLTIEEFPFDGCLWLKTQITHVSGEFVASIGFLYAREDAKCNSFTEAGQWQQTIGSIKTYQARYALKYLLALPMGKEEDFESKVDASNPVTESDNKPLKKGTGQIPGCLNDQQKDQLYALIRNDPYKKEILRLKYGVTYTGKLKVEFFDAAMKLFIEIKTWDEEQLQALIETFKEKK